MIIKELEKIDTEQYLSQVRLRNDNERQRRINEIYDNYPEMKELDREITSIAIKEARQRLKSQDSNDTYDFSKDISELSYKKKKLLTDNGYPENYLDPIYDCPICQDWGKIDGHICDCIKKLRVEELYKRSNLYNTLKKENFGTFSLEYYSKEPYEDKEMTPYENAERLYKKAQKFVDNFESIHDNLLIYGDTGLGKTFLSNCIAKEILDKGHSVLYLSSNELFKDVLSDYLMSHNTTNIKALESIYEYIYKSDLLIIDDLGSEVLSSFVKSQLFEIINKRMLTERSTLITTNLNLASIQDRYTERVMSRIADKYTLYPLYGDDIRYRRKK